ncbi:unnamed protein product [Pleuronectes platessa]|uniref:Uncharacterized protein n=1 Tax=Pleuronectes platessa TaxID=8262 RepID=A0A9N7VLB9_PLEPL|nr:unnamed protein product [Pleuronectes platessa]
MEADPPGSDQLLSWENRTPRSPPGASRGYATHPPHTTSGLTISTPEPLLANPRLHLINPPCLQCHTSGHCQSKAVTPRRASAAAAEGRPSSGPLAPIEQAVEELAELPPSRSTQRSGARLGYSH